MNRLGGHPKVSVKFLMCRLSYSLILGFQNQLFWIAEYLEKNF